MKSRITYRTLALTVAALAAVVACQQKPGPAENAGKKIDQAVENAGKKVDQAVEDAGKKVDKAADQLKDRVERQAAKSEVVMDDTEITARTKAAIFAEPGLKTLQISVDTVRGVVTLTGSVDSAANSKRAQSLAAAIAGVRSVDNRLIAAAAR